MALDFDTMLRHIQHSVAGGADGVQVCGLYPGRLVIDEVAGEWSLGSIVKAVFREAHGRLELDGTPVATFCADAPTFSATLAG